MAQAMSMTPPPLMVLLANLLATSGDGSNSISGYPSLTVAPSLTVSAEKKSSIDTRRLALTSCIVDAEIVAVAGTGATLPFQTLMSRGRKDVDEGSVAIHVKVFLFDLMQMNGQPLLHVPFRHRDDLMRAAFQPVPNRLDFVEAARFTQIADEDHDGEAVREMLHASFDARCEGIMVKVLGPVLVDMAGLTPAQALGALMRAAPPPAVQRLHSAIDFSATAQEASERLAVASEEPTTGASGGASTAAVRGTASTSMRPPAKRSKPGSAAARKEAERAAAGEEKDTTDGVDTFALSTYQPSKVWHRSGG